jgi:hypothetical protein
MMHTMGTPLCRRRRIPVHVLAFLLLGAIVNVAVAWTCTRLGTFHLPIDSQDGTMFKFGAQFEQALPHLPARIAAGWPVFAVTRNNWFNGLLPNPYPYAPIWPGFAINTMFYAFVIWMLFAVPAALRRKRRRARGLCPKCAYPVGTSVVCTECGAALRSNAPLLPTGEGDRPPSIA